MTLNKNPDSEEEEELPDLEHEREVTAFKVFFRNGYFRKYCIKYFSPSSASMATPMYSRSQRGRFMACEGCKYLKNEHLQLDGTNMEAESTQLKDATKWYDWLHMKITPMKTIGKINFFDQVENYEKLADFAILCDDSHPNLVLDLLMKEWKLQKPSLVLSVVGSNHTLSITNAQYNRVKTGLMKAVTSTESWVIGGGTATGVDGLVGEALREAQVLGWIGVSASKFHLIGITNWNTIDESARISKHQAAKRNYPYTYLVKQRKKAAKVGLRNDMVPLNPVFSHFANIEGGICGKWGQDIKVRSSTEQFIGRSPSKTQTSGEKLDGEGVAYKSTDEIGGLGIPIVLVVLGGDFDIFERCANALNNSVPVLLCEGTGFATDILCAALRLADPTTNELSEEAEENIMNQIETVLIPPKGRQKLFQTQGELNAAKHIHFVKECLVKSDHITVFRLDRSESTTMPLDECILKALLTSQTTKQGGSDPIELALEWRRCDDFMKELLMDFQDDINLRPNMEQLMTRALMEDQIAFVELFLDCGMEMSRFLTPKKLAELYEYSLQTCPTFANLLQRGNAKDGSQFSLKDVYHIVYTYTSATPKEKIVQGEKPIVEKESETDVGIEYGFDDPFQALFLWAVFSNKMEASEYFWVHSKRPMMLAVLGSHLWQVIGHKGSFEEGHGDTFEIEMKENRDKYRDYANSMLNKCWETNQEMAQKVIQTSFRTFGNKSLMEVAGFVGFQDFIAHPCCQVTIEHLWKGGLRCRSSQMLLALFFPPFIKKLKLYEKAETELNCDWTDDADDIPISTRSELQAALNTEDCHERKQRQSFKNKTKLFLNAPATKFITHTLAYLIFLTVATKFYLFEISEHGHWTLWEIITFSFMVSYILEEIRQILEQDATMEMKLRLWAQSEWNVLDAVYLSLGVMAFATKHLVLLDSRFHLFHFSKGVYGFVVMLMWLRILRFYQCSSRLGPMWIMIRKMLLETMIFMSVLAVVLIAFGICDQVLHLIYGLQNPYAGRQWIVLRPFFMFNGELFIESGTKQTGLLFLTVFKLFVGNALLVNILIAMYAEIFSSTIICSDTEWKSEFALLVQEYQGKTYFPPPLSVIETLYGIASTCRQKSSSVEESGEQKRQLRVFESYCLTKVFTEKLGFKSSDDIVSEIDLDIQLQQEKVRDAQIALEKMRKKLLDKKKKKKEEKRVKRWSQRREDLFEKEVDESDEEIVSPEKRNRMLFSNAKTPFKKFTPFARK